MGAKASNFSSDRRKTLNALSLIVTTYNQVPELLRCLESVLHQSHLPSEVLIADDGSKAETRSIVSDFETRFKKYDIPLVHVWHEDIGYRKAAIVNKAAQHASGEWLVFVDADCVLHPHFVRDHLAYSKTCDLFLGRRCDLGPKVSDKLRQQPFLWRSLRFQMLVAWSVLVGETRHANRLVRVPWRWLRSALRSDRTGDALGSNFSISKKAFFDLGGYDESLEHYWGEDGDLYLRARAAGLKIFSSRALALQAHLFHPRKSPPRGAEEEYLRKLSLPCTEISTKPKKSRLLQMSNE